ncbi:hypothetical protein HY04AAS1_1020 [Hydrogenobaculum sp. Y04AAS1]|uniref:cytochrome c n=1 Tax=Hydrogenobaculum sp. (strain Y04AAS1) TaxID=380749 RepID=UPI00015BC72D|nr:hypothetical protein HY04AAS1_1020 [Hydrogenobaculum sp. Y04AAS1]HCT66270.1 cytochrome c [Hydrogenobaculum sp.]
MRNLALTLGLLAMVSFGAFALTPQKIFEMHCMKCHNGKRAPSAKELHTKFAGKKKELVKAISHCRPAMALPASEREAIINWLSSK